LFTEQSLTTSISFCEDDLIEEGYLGIIGELHAPLHNKIIEYLRIDKLFQIRRCLPWRITHESFLFKGVELGIRVSSCPSWNGFEMFAISIQQRRETAKERSSYPIRRKIGRRGTRHYNRIQTSMMNRKSTICHQPAQGERVTITHKHTLIAQLITYIASRFVSPSSPS
jgi:hypothetical protein